MDMRKNMEAEALRMMTYGVYVLGAADNDECAAATVAWATQSSFEPPMVVVCVQKGRRAFPLVKRSGAFSLNFLSKGQDKIAADFYNRTRLENGALSGHPYAYGSTGAPILEEAPAWIEAKVVDVNEDGDHAVVIGEVADFGRHADTHA
ncbi:MAG: flavin reductase family protein, partial [Candidatus Methylomirabilis sp.]|nr:flavin reductase family protein [Deltaproteobacteria bacterium]